MFNWFRSAPRATSREPMDTPEIARMTPRELADLPLVPPMAPAREASRDSRMAAPAAARPAAC
ncbi:hypothetical protein PSM7751_03073 [Pseudooceanicola marinus]|uniref:Uncharacterized protein n=1 Tax=Pseudooceanicola marinus TaxID=396013 RepID=A0A1X6ZU22_9RHOB|nr:hypothetical protein [Pseudooceanicola marinus]PJE30599.1 hypothetical protein CVM50_10155 [Pseudooceanicola marinus]SLN61311.1 hypothetical protein PSM7751_03073 [Pseudooceanicola marinus]